LEGKQEILMALIKKCDGGLDAQIKNTVTADEYDGAQRKAFNRDGRKERPRRSRRKPCSFFLANFADFLRELRG
jgi:hypothetical protein